MPKGQIDVFAKVTNQTMKVTVTITPSPRVVGCSRFSFPSVQMARAAVFGGNAADYNQERGTHC